MGPIVAGIVSAFAVLLFLTVFGIASGVSALGGDDPATWGTAIAILLAFAAAMVGGMVGQNQQFTLRGTRTLITC